LRYYLCIWSDNAAQFGKPIFLTKKQVEKLNPAYPDLLFEAENKRKVEEFIAKVNRLIVERGVRAREEVNAIIDEVIEETKAKKFIEF